VDRFTRRHLPHWHPATQTFFVTFRLFGSLPEHVIERLRAEAKRLRQQPPRKDEPLRERALREGKRLFALTDEALAAEALSADSRTPRWLRDSRVASTVREAVRYRDGKTFRLYRYVIMPNHVHLLLEPLREGGAAASSASAGTENAEPCLLGSGAESGDRRPSCLSGVLQSLKGYTARQANKILGRTGSFWQDENYDHWVRDEAEFARIVEYIDQNPVKAGLCGSPREWPWCSAGEEGGAFGGSEER